MTDSYSDAADIREAAVADTVSTPPRRPWRWAMGAIFVGFLLWLAVRGPREVANWYLAAANNAMIDARYRDAIDAADSGLDWDEDFGRLLDVRARAKLELDDLEGSLADYNRLVEVTARDGETTEEDMWPLAARSTVLQRLGRWEEAIADWTTIVDFRRRQYEQREDSQSQYAYALALNNRAYIQGLARIDIPGALEDIDKAIEIRGREDDPTLIDTLGYLLLVDGQDEQALFYLQSAAALAKIQNDQEREVLKQQMRQVIDQRPWEARLRSLDEQYSIILHHRGEAYEAVGETEKAEADKEAARQLGYNPEKGIW